MCDPVTAITAVSTGVGFIQQSQSAQASRRAADRATDLAEEAALDRAANLSSRQRAARESAAADVDQVVRQSRQAQGQAAVAAAESGAAGNSVAALLRDFQRQELEFETRTIRNLRTDDLNAELEGRAISRQTEGRLQQIQANTVQRPNFLNALLRIGGSAIEQNTLRQQRLDAAGGR